MGRPPMGHPNGGPNGVMGCPNGVMGSLLTCTPHFASKNTILQPVFACFPHDAPPQAAKPLPATGLFWARLSALDTPTCVFPTHLWTF